MRIVVSFGHAALDARCEPIARSERFRGTDMAARALHGLVDAGHSLVATFAHGHPSNELRSADGPDARAMAVQEASLDGLYGYLLEQGLRNLCGEKRQFATIATHTLVDQRDPSFSHPTHMIGPRVDEAEARLLERTRRWTMARDDDFWRRVIATPEPIGVLQSHAIKTLLNTQHTVICSGSGVAVCRDVQGRESGVEAIVDADMGASRLASEIGADACLFATDVPFVYDGWPSRERKPIYRLSTSDSDLERFAEDSMRPKVEAAMRFARTGHQAVIGSMNELIGMLDGRSGTRVESP